MITYKLTNCEECTTIPVLLSDIDCKLTELAKSQYNNVIYSLNNYISPCLQFDLLMYKNILNNKTCNADYASCYSLDQISSRVKTLIHK